MPRKIFIPTTNPYHITGRCINQEWFAIPMSTVWEIMTNHLFFLKYAFYQRIHAFVLMNNHFHLLMSAPNQNISQAMQYFMKETSRSIGKEAGRTNQIWGSRFGRCEITSHHYYLNTYKYIYQNPIRAYITQRVEEYPFSTLYGLLGNGPLYVPLSEDVELFSNVLAHLNWLNQVPSSEKTEAVKKALQKKIFCYPKIDSRLHLLENDLL